jgi:hypothetical protein
MQSRIELELRGKDASTVSILFEYSCLKQVH